MVRKCGDTGTHKSKQTGLPCGSPVKPEATACRFHGGTTKKAMAKAAERKADTEARKLLGKLSIQPIDNPLTELKKLAGEVVAWKNLIADHVAELERLRYSGEGGEQIRGEIILFERALDRCGTVLGMIARLNIDERLATITEGQASMVSEALSVALAALGLPLEQQQEAKVRVARHLRSVAS